ncbi:MAG: hypothetical protein DME52_04650, partial [Verrucomicrobia bacterium]
MSGAAYDAELIDSHLSDLRTLAGYSVHVARFPPAPLSILQERTGMAYSSDDISSVQDKGPPKAQKRALTAPFLDFQRLIVLALDPPQSSRGPTSICRPFSHKC